MFDRVSTLFAALRRPEYTGPNRCLPCTVVNAAITLGVAGVLWVVTPYAGATALAVGAVVIALRGYLVPGTPTVTRRYLPEEILRRFGKTSTENQPEVDSSNDRLDPETILVGAGAVTDCPDCDDLCLTDSFRRRWLAAIDELRGCQAAQQEQLSELVGVPADAVSFGEVEAGVVYAEADGNRIGQWLSRAALLADVAAAKTFDQDDNLWDGLDAADRGTVLSVLRIFLERCPACDEAVTISEETTDTCCWSQESITVRCTDCNSRLYSADATSFDLATRT